MKCNLIKTLKKKVVDGKEKTYSKYYLVFENGKTARIKPEYIDPEYFDDEDKKLEVDESNKTNALTLSLLADTVKNKDNG